MKPNQLPSFKIYPQKPTFVLKEHLGYQFGQSTSDFYNTLNSITTNENRLPYK